MRSDQSIPALLRHTAAFARLSPEMCERLAALTTERSLKAGEFLVQEGDAGKELFLVVSGTLFLTHRPTFKADTVSVSDAGETVQSGVIRLGDVVGELSLLTGHPHPVTIRAIEATVVRSLSSIDFDRICAESPQEMATAIDWMARKLDSFQISAAIEESRLLRELPVEARRELAEAFVRVDRRAGEAIYREEEPGDALYLILSGRVRLFVGVGSEASPSPDGRVIAELGKGDVFGELSLLTGDSRSDSAIAVRDSHLAHLNKPVFDRLVTTYPTEMLGLFSRQMAGRLRQANLTGSRGRHAEGRVPVAIAVLPLNPSEQSGGGRDFAGELVRQLSAFGATLHLNRAVVSRIFPENKDLHGRFDQVLSSAGGQPKNTQQIQINEIAERRLLAWLDDMEMLYRHVVYEADYQTGVVESAWTSRCLRQADVLLMVAGGPADPRDSEKTMVRLSSKALPSVKTTLVLIHAGGPDSVSHTRVWESSLGVRSHEHVRRTISGTGSAIHPGDVGRIARKLNRQSVGLVLGGGFALGLAHIGVIDAMRELEIPIDFVGGTSMGAIIAAACAMEFSHDQMLEVMDKGCAQALKGDYTLPIVSLLTGKKVALALGKYLEHKDIEDFWIPYFAISASLVKARMVVHREGSALKSVLASCRAPGMFPPLGWNGDVLVDGGLVNNIPADVMRETIRGGSDHEQGGGTVFAADVSPDSEFLDGNAEAQFGMDLSGWKVARRNNNPLRRFRKPVPTLKHATIADILMRLIRLGGVAHNQQIRASADLYMTIPLEQFSVKDFHRGEEMARAGYDFSRQALTQWIEEHGRPWLGNS